MAVLKWSQMNLADSERMAGTLESVGYVCAEDASDADVIVYNTCSIREKAEQKVYSALGMQVRPLCFFSVPHLQHFADLSRVA